MMLAAGPEAAGNASRALLVLRRLGGSGLLGLAVLALGVVAGILMIAAEFSTIVSVEVLTVPCEDQATLSRRDDCVKSGGEQHLYALVLLGLLTFMMAWGAGPGDSRPAAFALVGLGVFVLAMALVVDVPKVGDTGVIGENYEQADAKPGAGLWLELAASLAAVTAGVMRLRWGRTPTE